MPLTTSPVLHVESTRLQLASTGGHCRSATFRYRKSSALLAYALSHPQQLVAREALAEWFWPQHDPSAARRNLRAVIADVQQALRAVGLADGLRIHRDWLRWEDIETRVVALPSGTGGDEDTPATPDSVDAKPPQPQPESPTQQRHRPSLSDLQMLALLSVRWQLAEPSGTEAHPEPCPTDTWQTELRTWASRHHAQIIALDEHSSILALGVGALCPSCRFDAIRLAGHLHRLARNHGHDLRMGLTFGPMEIQQGSIHGWRTKLAERLAMAADTGEIICDQSHADQAQFLGFASLGMTQLRGFARAFHLYKGQLDDLQAPWPQVAALAHLPLVGRESTLDTLQDLYRETAHGARLCIVEAPSGMGKTRLALEWWRTHRQYSVWIEGRPEYLAQPWAALRQWVIQQSATLPESLAADRLTLLQAFASTGSVAQAERPAFAEAVLALSGAQTRTWIIDDAQWIDRTSWEFLVQLAEQGPAALWLCTVRTPARAPSTASDALPLSPLPKLPIDRLNLEPLSPAEARRLWRHAHTEDDAPEETDWVAAAQGCPLWILADSTPEHASMLASHWQSRINAMGELRSIMDLAAWLGQTWSHADLQNLGASSDQMTQALQLAAGLDLITTQHRSESAFNHPSVREFLIETQSADTRRECASRVALLRQQQDNWAAAAALWVQIGEKSPARTCWQAAAGIAMNRGDHHAASQHFDALREIAYVEDARDPIGLRMRLAHGLASLVARGYGAPIIHTLAQELPHVLTAIEHQTAPDWDDIAFGSTFLQYMSSSSNGLDGLVFSAQLRRDARTPAQHLVAAFAEGNTRFWRGEHDLAEPWLQRAVAWSATVPLDQRCALFVTDPLVFSGALLCWLHALAGTEPPTPSAYADDGADLPSAQDRCIHHCLHAFRAYTRQDVARLQHHAEEAFAAASMHRYALWTGIAQLQRQLAAAMQGRAPDWTVVEEASAAVGQGYAAGLPTGQWMVADMLRLSGQADHALALCDQWLARAPQQEHQHCTMDIHRIRAQSLEALDQPEAAQQAWRRARAVGEQGRRWGWLRLWGLCDPQAP